MKMPQFPKILQFYILSGVWCDQILQIYKPWYWRNKTIGASSYMSVPIVILDSIFALNFIFCFYHMLVLVRMYDHATALVIGGVRVRRLDICRTPHNRSSHLACCSFFLYNYDLYFNMRCHTSVSLVRSTTAMIIQSLFHYNEHELTKLVTKNSANYSDPNAPQCSQ